MSVKTSILNSATPNRGAKPQDFEVLGFATHLLSEGELYHEETASTSAVVENTTPGMSVFVNKKSYLARVSRDDNPAPFNSFNPMIEILDTETVVIPANSTGDDLVGAIIIRVKETSIQAGVTNSDDGLSESTVEYIVGTSAVALTDSEIQAEVGADFFLRLADITVEDSETTILDSDISQTVGMVKMKGISELDMNGGQIRNLPTATEDDEPMRKDQILSLVSANAQFFGLTGTRANLSAPRELSWNATISADNYEVYRDDGAGGAFTKISDETGTYYEDSEVLTSVDDDYKYYIKAVNTTKKIEVESNEILFSDTSFSGIPLGYYGDGSDGAYSNGDLEYGRIYQFTSFSLTSPVTISGEAAQTGGKIIILVTGNITIGSSGQIVSSAGMSNKDSQTFSVGSTSYSVASTDGTPGARGGGGNNSTVNGLSGGYGGYGGEYGTIVESVDGKGGYGGDGSHGSAGGTGGMPGAPGSTGGVGGQGEPGGSGGGAESGAGGGGGGQGGLSKKQNGILFVCGGNATLSGTVTAPGFDGGNGGNGGGGGGPNGAAGSGGGGGGGAGANGSGGMNVKILHSGAVSGSITSSSLGGDGGQGGQGGLGGYGAVNGFAGTAGTSGTDGIITTVQL